MFCRELAHDIRRVIVGSLRAILSCNFTTLDEAIFRHPFVTTLWTRYLSTSMVPFTSCLMWQKNLTNCLPILVSSCSRSSVVAVKLIRLHMSLVEELMTADPELTLIQFVRDPRDILESWRSVSGSNLTQEQMLISANVLCTRMSKDCVIRHRLEKSFPGRILVVRYEDLVTNTYRVLRKIYTSLLQLSIPTSVRLELVRKIYEHNDVGSVNIKKDGNRSAHKWKQDACLFNRQASSRLRQRCLSPGYIALKI